MTITEAERLRRFWGRVDKSGDCWLWTGAQFKSGYGLVKWEARTRKAHQIAWELTRGPLPFPLEPDHLCRVRNCVRPEHIEWVTHAENIRRARMAVGAANGNGRKTHCAQGHEYTPDNTRVGKSGKRYCRACHREDSARRWREGKGSPGAKGRPRTITCPGAGKRTKRGKLDEPDRCPVCERIAYVRVDGTTGVHYR